MEIREYTSNDFGTVLKILMNSFPELSNKIENALMSEKSLELDKNKYIQLVAVENNNVVGYLIATRSNDPIIKRTNYWIDYVCVDLEYRGRGIAKKLLMKIEDIAREENVLYLQLTSSRFRTGARKLYLDLGFEIRESDIFRKVL